MFASSQSLLFFFALSFFIILATAKAGNEENPKGKTIFGYETSKILKATWDQNKKGKDFMNWLSSQAVPIILNKAPVSKWTAFQNWKPENLDSSTVKLDRIHSLQDSEYYLDFHESRPLSSRIPPKVKSIEMDNKEFFDSITGDQESQLYYIGSIFEEEGFHKLADDIRPHNFFFVDDINPSDNGPESENYVDVAVEQNGLVLIGGKAPTHNYFESTISFVVQIKGKSKWYLSPPSEHSSLYVNPWFSSLHRNSQLNFTQKTDFETILQWPEFVNVELREGELQEGEVLYIPPYWFRRMEPITNWTLSLTFTNPSFYGYLETRIVQEGLPLPLSKVEPSEQGEQKLRVTDPKEMSKFLSLFVKSLISITLDLDASQVIEYVQNKLIKNRFVSVLGLLGCSDDQFNQAQCGEKFEDISIQGDGSAESKQVEEFSQKISKALKLVEDKDILELELLDYVEKVSTFVVGVDNVGLFWRCLGVSTIDANTSPKNQPKDEL